MSSEPLKIANESETTGSVLGMYLDYDPESGLFRRNLTTNPNSKKGDIISNTNDEGYIVLFIGGARLRGHRVAWCWMTGEWPKQDIDHKNGVRSDNRFCNLRPASRSQNLQNLCIRSLNTSGVPGVGWDAERNKWTARITVNCIPMFLGRFVSFERAVEVRKAAEEKYFGEFSLENSRNIQ